MSLVLVPLLALIFLIIGNSMVLTLVPLQLQHANTGTMLIGFISSAYYVGIMFGSFLSEAFVLRIGHVRTFAAFGALTTVVTLLHVYSSDGWYWLILRFLSGYCTATLLIVIESWVLIYSDDFNRGSMLALYMLCMYAAQTGGQFLLYFITAYDFIFLLSLCSIFMSLAIATLTISKADVPVFEKTEPLGLTYLFSISPSGVIGCCCSGLLLSVIYTLFPSHYSALGFEPKQVALTMGCIIFGGMLLQYPIGLLSDVIPRQKVIIGVCVTAFCIMALLTLMELSEIRLLLLFMFGGCIFTIYPLSITHACGYLDKGNTVAAIQGLLVVYALGASFGPTLGSAIVKVLPGETGLNFYIMIVLALFLLTIFLRAQQRPPLTVEEQENFVGMSPQNTPLIAELAPKTEPVVIDETSQQKADY